jgi:excisionase family DNA binding protein
MMLTPKEVVKNFFRDKISVDLLYDMVKQRKIPHVRMGGKILFDEDKLASWWLDQLERSTEIPQMGIRKIV